MLLENRESQLIRLEVALPRKDFLERTVFSMAFNNWEILQNVGMAARVAEKLTREWYWFRGELYVRPPFWSSVEDLGKAYSIDFAEQWPYLVVLEAGWNCPGLHAHRVPDGHVFDLVFAGKLNRGMPGKYRMLIAALAGC